MTGEEITAAYESWLKSNGYPPTRARSLAFIYGFRTALNNPLRKAAPDLLAELKRMVEHFGVWANDHSEEATTETWAALHCAKEVIAKAEADND